ncbi:MAG: family 10 glycosylhydrolase [Acutalibacteraceae bacterium]
MNWQRITLIPNGVKMNLKRWVVEYESGKYFNPAYAEVRKYIADGVKEIVQNYDVDEFNLMIIFIQRRTVSLTKRNTMLIKKKQAKTAFMELLEWRQANINAMVSQVYAEVKQANRSSI